MNDEEQGVLALLGIIGVTLVAMILYGVTVVGGAA